MEQTGKSGNMVILEFMEGRLGLGPEGEPVDEADPDIFKIRDQCRDRASRAD